MNTNEIIEQLNQRLLEMQKRIGSILTSLPLGLLLISSNGKDIAACNSQIEEIFGYKQIELSGQPVTRLFPELDSLDVSAKALRVTALRKGGEVITCDIFVSEIDDEGGRRVFVHVQDVTERQRLEQMRKKFVAMVSHDLRTPLTSISMGLDMLQEGSCGDLSDSAKTVLRQAQSSSDFVISLVTELLDAEKLQTSEFVPDLRRTTVKAVVDKALIATEAISKQAVVSIEADITNDMFQADEDRIAQVLINLIGNAIKYSPRQSTVVVKAGLEGAGVKFRVIDRGPGIPADMQTAIFEPYRQLQQPKGTKRLGFGLGLAICKLLVDAHKGSISVTSQVGAGSTFEFSIPLVDGPT